MLTHGRFVMTQTQPYGEDGTDEPTMEYTRRRTMAEPTLPILPECPSQENSSVSRMDMSVHSGRDNDTETIHSQNTSRKGSAAFHSNYTLSRADAPDIIIENYNIADNLDNLSNRRHDSITSRNASTSTHAKQDELNNSRNKVGAVPSCSYHSPTTRAKRGDSGAVTAADIVNGLVDTNGDILYMDADSNENVELELKEQVMDIGEGSSSSDTEDVAPSYYESIV